MAEYITKKDVELVLRQFKKGFRRTDEICAINGCILEIQDMDSVDVVSRGVFDQIKFERDIAIGQLESYGISLGEKADVTKVRHGHWEYGKWEQGHWVKGNERCRCSVCHRDFAVDNLNIWHGCPQCLAKMDGDGNA